MIALKIFAGTIWLTLTFLTIISSTVLGFSLFNTWALFSAAGVTWIVLKLVSSMLDSLTPRRTGEEENISLPEMVVCEGCKEPTPRTDPKRYWCGYEKVSS